MEGKTDERRKEKKREAERRRRAKECLDIGTSTNPAQLDHFPPVLDFHDMPDPSLA